MRIERRFSVNKNGLMEPDHDGNMHVVVDVFDKVLNVYVYYGNDGNGEFSDEEIRFENFIIGTLENMGEVDDDDVVRIVRNDTTILSIIHFVEKSHIIFDSCYRSGRISKKK